MNKTENKKYSYCFLCEDQFTKSNTSNDHIILNSIGGRRKVKNFSCKNCDNRCGHRWDSALAKQLNPLSLFLKINRERGDVPSQVFETTKGEKITFQSDGHMTLSKPEVELKPVGDLIELRINARSLREAREIATGLKRKFPSLDIEELMRKAEVKSYNLQDALKISFSFGISDAGRSIVKSALALAVQNEIDPQSCQKALRYLKEDHAEKCLGFYYARDLLLDRPQDKVFHCVAISGNARTGCLLGYVEIFSTQRIVVCLSDSYFGPDVHDIYAIDPIAGEDLKLSFAIPLAKEDLAAVYQNEELPLGVVEQAVSHILGIAHKNNLEDETNIVFKQASDYALKKYGWDEEEALTEEQANLFTKCMMEQLQPFLINQIIKSPKSGLL
jgi:HNH endonuclease